MPTAPPTDAEPHVLAKSLRWWDGVALTLSLPAALFVSLGYSVGTLGAWAALLLWGLIAAMAVLHNRLYAEMGAMFSDKSGGIALYASEAWRTRLPALAPLATYAYWFAWATAPAIWGLTVAQILTTQCWPEAHATLDLGLLRLELPQLVALAVALLSWALAMVQLRFAMGLMTLAGLGLAGLVLLYGAAALLGPHWSAASFGWRLPAGATGLRHALAWLFVMAWSAYAVEAAASFIPEFRDTVADTRRALRVSALWLLGVCLLAPLAITGLVGEPLMGQQPDGFLQRGIQLLFGGGAGLVTGVLVFGVLLLSVMGTADAGRALYQSACDGLTVRQFARLNRHGVPARAITLQLLINGVLVLVVGNALAVIVAGNVGYVLAHLLAVSGFVVLRKDRPTAPRPIRLGPAWPVVALLLTGFDAVILVAGLTGASITGYGGAKEVAIALGVLALSQGLYQVRRWQDRHRHPADAPPRGQPLPP
jgi:hypothetical protein